MNIESTYVDLPKRCLIFEKTSFDWPKIIYDLGLGHEELTHMIWVSPQRGVTPLQYLEILFFLLINFRNFSKLLESFRKNHRYPPPIFNNFVFLPVSFRKFSKNRKKFSTPPPNIFDLATPLLPTPSHTATDKLDRS